MDTKIKRSGNLSELSMLKLAVEAKNVAQVRKILSEKPQLNRIIVGDILWDAILSNQVEIASMLVKADVADLNKRRSVNGPKSSFLHVLVGKNDPRYHQLAMMMMERGADADALDDTHPMRALTPLFYATRGNSNIEIIKELVHRGSTVDSSHIMDAAINNYENYQNALEIVKLLVGGFVDDETKKYRIDNTLFTCSWAVFNDNQILPAVRILLDMELPLEDMKMGQLTFLRAIQTNKVSMVQLLIKYGFNVNKPGEGGILPLYAAAKLKEAVITEMLIQAGAIVNFEGLEGYAIHAACLSESIKNIEMLLRHGANIQVINKRGQTPLSAVPFTKLISNSHQLLIKQLTILMNKGEIINDSDLKTIESHSGFKIYYRQCSKELKKMKLMKIVNDFSFFTMLVENVNEIAFLTRNSNFVENYNKVERKDEFPIYYEKMDFVFENAKKRKDSLSEREKAIYDSLKNVLAFGPLEKVIYYFYMDEI